MDNRKKTTQNPYSAHPSNVNQEYSQWQNSMQCNRSSQNYSQNAIRPPIDYRAHNQPQIQDNNEIYGGGYSPEYNHYRLSNQSSSYPSSPPEQPSFYGEQINLSSQSKGSNYIQGFNIDTFQEYSSQSQPFDRYDSGLLSPPIHRETDGFRKQYNEIQQMKLQQQMHYQTQAQFQQQQTFAQRQLLLQQIHGVKPPPNLVKMQETELPSASPQSPEEFWKNNQAQNSPIKSPSKSTDSSSSSRTLSLKSPKITTRMPNAKVTISGMLYKQGSDGLKVWRKRWFVLADYCLFYYKNQDEQKLLGSILLPSYKISICKPDDKVMRKYAFKCEHANMRTYVLAATEFEQMTRWIKALIAASLMQDINLDDPTSYQSTSNAVNFSGQTTETVPKIKRATYVNAPPKPRRSNDCASPNLDERYITHQSAAAPLQKTVNYPIENIYQHGRFPEKLPVTSSTVSSPQHEPLQPKIEYNNQHGFNKAERRTPEAYGRSAFVMGNEKPRLSDYEDIYSAKRQNDPNVLRSDPLSPVYDPHFPDEYQHQTNANNASGIKKKKMLINNQQQKVPRPHSVDFLEYESRMQQQAQIPIQQKPKVQPQRPKSSLDVNIPYDPSSEIYYSEEKYAEKMREFGKFLKKDIIEDVVARPTTLQQPEGFLTEPLSLRKPMNDTNFSNWTLKEKPFDEYSRKPSTSNDDSFIRSASARLPSKEGEDDMKLQQREESMKRLLEWKQRMLQSPLTKKSTPASISLGVMKTGLGKPGYDRTSMYSSEDDDKSDSGEMQAERSETHKALTINNSHPMHENISSKTVCTAPILKEDDTQKNNLTPTATQDTSESASVLVELPSVSTVTEENVVSDEPPHIDSSKEEYTDNDLDEALDDEKEPDLKTTEENTAIHTPPLITEEHYLPMSPRKESLAAPQETPAKNSSVFNEPTNVPTFTEDSPYVEMNNGIDNKLCEDGQTYEMVCVSKPEHLYMELCNFATGDDKKDVMEKEHLDDLIVKQNTLIKPKKDCFPPLPDLVHNYDTLSKKKKYSSDNSESQLSFDEQSLKRMSISDSFRPASYYLSASRSMLNLKEKSEKTDFGSDNLSICSNDKANSSIISNFSSSSTLSETPLKKKTISLMISGSRPSMHDTICRGEKIRRSRGNLVDRTPPVMSSEASTSQSLNFDSDSFSTCTEGRNSFSSKCESIPSNFASETASLSEYDENNQFKHISLDKTKALLNESLNSIRNLDGKESPVKYDKTLDIIRRSQNSSFSSSKEPLVNKIKPSPLFHDTLPISHSRSYSSPAHTSFDMIKTQPKRMKNNFDGVDNNETDEVDSPQGFAIVDSTKFFKENGDQSFNGNLNSLEESNKLKEFDEEKLIKPDKTKPMNSETPCHCRSHSSDQPAPYYYSDLSNNCEVIKHFMKTNSQSPKSIIIQKKSNIIQMRNDTERPKLNKLSTARAVSVEFLSNHADYDNLRKPDLDKDNLNCDTVLEGEKVWDVDVLWRENLRRASQHHAKSMDDLDSINSSPNKTLSNDDKQENNTCKLTRKVNYVNEDVKAMVEIVNKQPDVFEEDENDVYVSLMVEHTNAKCEGEYEYLKFEGGENIMDPKSEIKTCEKPCDEENMGKSDDSDAYVEVLNRDAMEMNRRPSAIGRNTSNIPVRAVSPRVRWDSNKSIDQAGIGSNTSIPNENWLWKMEQLANGGELKAGDLLGRSHEELLMLLLLLEKNQTKYQQTIQQCLRQIDSLKDQSELERMRAQLSMAEKQEERTRPLLQLVDSMVRLGALYTQPLQRLESAHRARAALLQHLARFGGEDGQEAEVRVQQLRMLEKQLVDDAHTLHQLSSSVFPDVTSDTHTNMSQSMESGDPLNAGPSQRSDDDTARDLDEELARVHHMLALNSKKLEETVADNTRLERALLDLRNRLHQAPNHAPSAAALHNETRRAAELAAGLQRRRQELGAAVAALAHRAHALTETRRAASNKAGDWRETEIDTDRNMSSANVRDRDSYGPLYVHTEPQYADGSMTSQGNTSQEKQEIKTVRIVKRESERRQRDRERLYTTSDWYSPEIQSISNELSKYGKGNSDWSQQLGKLSLEENSTYSHNTRSYQNTQGGYYDTLERNSRIYRSANDLNMYEESMLSNGGLHKVHDELSPVFQSKAAKEIITEMSDDSANYKRAVPKVKRRHYTAPTHHLSTNELTDTQVKVVSRARDDADLARALRISASSASRPTRAARMDIKAIDALLAAPSKIPIPERYKPEKSPELTPEEIKKRHDKVESIKKMLSSSTTDPSLSPDSDDKRQREHLLHMNQILAHQVMEVSKLVAARAEREAQLPDTGSGDSDERSPEIELPLYQQRENYFS